MANFIDRNVEFPHRFKLTKVGSNEAPITVDITREQGDGNLQPPYNEGSKLNAANLNAAFDEKQDKLVAGSGIKLVNNVISLEDGIFTDYEHIAQRLVGNSKENNAKWIMVPNSNYFEWGAHYYSTVEDDAVRYASASVEFTAEDFIYNSELDGDPTVAVCFADSVSKNRNIHCTFGFLKNRVRIIEESTWKKLKQADDIYFSKKDGKPVAFKVRVVRSKSGGENYVYRLFLNDMLVLTFNGATNTDYNSIRIGTIGCRATLKNWKVNGSY